MKKLFTVSEVAELLRVSKETVWRYGRNGQLQTIRVGRTVRFLLPEGVINV